MKRARILLRASFNQQPESEGGLELQRMAVFPLILMILWGRWFWH